jgi:phosphoserine phosphatase
LIITKGMEDCAKLMAEKFGFDKGFGSKINENGKVIELVGTRNYNFNGIKVKTKIEKVKEFCEEKGIKFDKKKVCIISDDIYDLRDMMKAHRCILTISDNPVSFQKLAIKLKLFDSSTKNDFRREEIIKAIKG